MSTEDVLMAMSRDSVWLLEGALLFAGSAYKKPCFLIWDIFLEAITSSNPEVTGLFLQLFIELWILTQTLSVS